jgi:hypothetical protein
MNKEISSETLIDLGRLVAQDEIDCIDKPNILTATDRMDVLHCLRSLINDKGFRLRQMDKLIEECEAYWEEEIDEENKQANELESEKYETLRQMGN